MSAHAPHAAWVAFSLPYCILAFAPCVFPAPVPKKLPVKVCVVQLSNWFGARHDVDSPRLAKELSTRRLKDGRQIVGLYMRKEKDRRLESAEIKRLGCDYVVEVWPHDTTTAGSFGTMGGGTPNPPSSAPGEPAYVVGSDTLNFRMMRAGSRKVIASASATAGNGGPNGRWVSLSWYQILAGDIVEKLSTLH